MKNKFILIISNRNDITTDLVVKRLKQRMILYKRFNTEEFPYNVNSSIELNKKNSLSIFIKHEELKKSDILSIWYRRPIYSFPKNSTLNYDEYKYVIQESNSFLMNLWVMLKDKKWVNNPIDLFLADRKTFQLKIAKKCNLIIPQTIVTNNFELAKKFLINRNKKVIVKPIGNGKIDAENNFSIYTTDLENKKFIFDKESIEACPCILQEKINKKFDVRVSVFGNDIFAHKIIIKNKSNDSIDWRVTDPNDVIYEVIDIPIKLKIKIKKYMHLLRLEYGALDFIIDNNDKWVFIEINPSGQFAWLEIATGSKLIDSLINLLAN